MLQGMIAEFKCSNVSLTLKVECLLYNKQIMIVVVGIVVMTCCDISSVDYGP